MSRIVATIEARMTSSRLPGKVLMPAAGKPLLEIMIERVRRARVLDAVVVATTVNAVDDPVIECALRSGARYYRGSEADVMARVAGALRSAHADVCVELTADCPLMDPLLIEEAVQSFLGTRGQNQYVSNSDPFRSVPLGFDIQVFEASALYEAETLTNDPADREHVSYIFYRPESGNRWTPRFIRHRGISDVSDIRVTLDYQEDYDLIRRIHEDLAPAKPRYCALDVIEWVQQHPDLHAVARNKHPK